MENLLHDISWVVPFRSPFLTPIFQGFTWLGYLPFFMIFLSLGFWLWDKDKITRLAVLIALSGILNAYLKDFWADPRPPLDLRMDGGVGESYGLPSGHAQVATVMWFWLAWEIRKTWAWITATILVSGVIFSRIYLGVHDVEDVAVGFILGLANLAVFRWFISEHFRHWHDLHPGWQVALILLLQPLLYFTWPDAEGPEYAFGLGLFLAGWWAGAKLNKHHFDFERHPEWWAIVAAGTLGIVGLFALFSGIGKLADLLDLGDYSRQTSILLVAVYMTVLAPWAFRLARIGK